MILSWSADITINQRKISEVIIDPHYEEKHSESINDELVLNLVKALDGGNYIPQTRRGVFEYFVRNDISYGGKLYRLIWTLEDTKIFIGVVNAFRRK